MKRFDLLLAGIGITLLPGAFAAAPLPASVVACQEEKDDTKRLACYDREVRRHGGTPEERFGLKDHRAPAATPGDPSAAPGDGDENELKHITATITAISKRPHGESVLTLDNGQVWAQTQAGSPLRVRIGDSVTIRSAALGSFLLSGPRGGSTRVERVR